MKTKKYNWTNLIFLTSSLVLLTLSIFSYQRFVQQKNSADWVNNTYFVKLKLEEAFASLIDAEAGQRGYLITKDSIFLKQFISSSASISRIVSDLDSLVVDPEHLSNLKEFNRLVRLRLNWLNVVFDSAQHLNANQLATFLIQSKLISDTVRAHIGIMEKKEDHLLTLRIKEKQRQEKKASAIILLFSFFSLSVLMFSFFRLKTESALLNKSKYNSEILEHEVNERTAEIKEINRKLNDQNTELERKNEELSSFTYIASHDLKEPLRKIETFSEKIIENEKQNLSEKGKNYFERIIAAIRRMQNLIDSVFVYAQADLSSGFQLTDLSQTAEHAIDTLREVIAGKDASIEYSSLPKINAIPEQMEQLFTNLLSNSLKYSKAGTKPHIKITTETLLQKVNGSDADNNVLKIDFTDNGIGFDENYKDKIFQIFQRLHSKDLYSGTGIGLAICKKIVENHNGRISVRSTPGKGSVFSVFLPENLISNNH